MYQYFIKMHSPGDLTLCRMKQLENNFNIEIRELVFSFAKPRECVLFYSDSNNYEDGSGRYIFLSEKEFNEADTISLSLAAGIICSTSIDEYNDVDTDEELNNLDKARKAYRDYRKFFLGKN